MGEYGSNSFSSNYYHFKIQAVNSKDPDQTVGMNGPICASVVRIYLNRWTHLITGKIRYHLKLLMDSYRLVF